MLRMKRVKYNPDTKSVAVPIIAHSNEIVLNVQVAKELYRYLKSGQNIPKSLRDKLLYLYHHTPQ